MVIMEKDKIILGISLIIAILLLFYSLSLIFYPEKIQKYHIKSLEKSNNIISKYYLEKNKKNNYTIITRISGIGGLIMSIIMIILFSSRLFFK